MKFAIFGDVHANLEALHAMLTDAAENDCTDFICIGDIVGYNANPSECLRVIQKLDCPVIKGNHDEEASLDTDLVGLNPLAEAALSWTRAALSEEEKEWLRNLRLLRQVRDFTIVHATLDTPSGWAYVMNKFDAMASFSYQFTQVCFYGHTHAPVTYVKEGSVTERREPVIRLETGKKYFVNVGSVGQPRDGNWRSSYAIFDYDNKVITNRRVEYDIQTAQSKIISEGLPEMLASRLLLGK